MPRCQALKKAAARSLRYWIFLGSEVRYFSDEGLFSLARTDDLLAEVGEHMAALERRVTPDELRHFTNLMPLTLANDLLRILGPVRAAGEQRAAATAAAAVRVDLRAATERHVRRVEGGEDAAHSRYRFACAAVDRRYRAVRDGRCACRASVAAVAARARCAGQRDSCVVRFVAWRRHHDGVRRDVHGGLGRIRL